MLRRTLELGVRVTLGATRAGVVRSVLRGAGAVVLPGVVAGGLAAVALSRFVARFLYGVAPSTRGRSGWRPRWWGPPRSAPPRRRRGGPRA